MPFLFNHQKEKRIKQSCGYSLVPRDRPLSKVFPTSASEYLVIKLFHDHIRLHNSEAVIPLHSTVREFLNLIERQIIPNILLAKLSEIDFQFHEGGLFVELHDYRHVASLPQDVSRGKIGHQGMSSRKPSIKRLLLKPAVDSIISDMKSMVEKSIRFSKHSPFIKLGTLNSDFALQVESEILRMTEDRLILDPSFEDVTKALNVMYYRHGLIMDSKWDYYKKTDPSKKPHSDMFMNPDSSINSNAPPRFRRLALLEELKKRKFVIDSEPYAGLDSKKSRKPSELMLNYLPDMKKVVRTIRMEQEKADGSRVFYSLNVFMLPSGAFEGLVRIGNAPDTSLRGYSFKFPILDAQAVEVHANNFKYLNQVFDGKIKCSADLSAMNTSVVRAASNSAANSRVASTNRALQNAMSGIVSNVSNVSPVNRSMMIQNSRSASPSVHGRAVNVNTPVSITPNSMTSHINRGNVGGMPISRPGSNLNHSNLSSRMINVPVNMALNATPNSVKATPSNVSNNNTSNLLDSLLQPAVQQSVTPSANPAGDLNDLLNSVLGPAPSSNTPVPMAVSIQQQQQQPQHQYVHHPQIIKSQMAFNNPSPSSSVSGGIQTFTGTTKNFVPMAGGNMMETSPSSVSSSAVGNNAGGNSSMDSMLASLLGVQNGSSSNPNPNPSSNFHPNVAASMNVTGTSSTPTGINPQLLNNRPVVTNVNMNQINPGMVMGSMQQQQQQRQNQPDFALMKVYRPNNPGMAMGGGINPSQVMGMSQPTPQSINQYSQQQQQQQQQQFSLFQQQQFLQQQQLQQQQLQQQQAPSKAKRKTKKGS